MSSSNLYVSEFSTFINFILGRLVHKPTSAYGTPLLQVNYEFSSRNSLFVNWPLNEDGVGVGG